MSGVDTLLQVVGHRVSVTLKPVHAAATALALDCPEGLESKVLWMETPPASHRN